VFPAIRQHLGEPVAPTGDQPHNRAVLAIARASAAPTPDEAPVISTRCPAAENATAQGWPRTSTFGAELSEFATTSRRWTSSQHLHSICTDSSDPDTCHAFAG